LSLWLQEKIKFNAIKKAVNYYKNPAFAGMAI